VPPCRGSFATGCPSRLGRSPGGSVAPSDGSRQGPRHGARGAARGRARVDGHQQRTRAKTRGRALPCLVLVQDSAAPIRPFGRTLGIWLVCGSGNEARSRHVVWQGKPSLPTEHARMAARGGSANVRPVARGTNKVACVGAIEAAPGQCCPRALWSFRQKLERPQSSQSLSEPIKRRKVPLC